MKGAPQVPSLGDRGGYATGLYRTPTTLGHTTKTWSQSSFTKHREAAKMRRQRNMAKMKEQIKTSGKKLNEMEITIYQMLQNTLYKDAQRT